LRKVTISFVMSVRPSAGTTRLPLDGFSWNFIFDDFSKICRENQISLKSSKNKEYFTWRPIYIFCSFLLRMKNVLNKFVEKFEIRILCSKTFFFRNCAAYEIICKNTVERGRPQMTIWRMRIACWISKATNTHTACVIRIAFPLQKWHHESSSILPYAYIAWLVAY